MADLEAMRSLLFVPGSRMDRVDKAIASAADLVIIDLEDAVAQDQKEKARADVAAKLAEIEQGRVLVRVNGPATAQFPDDVTAVAHENLAAVVVPMIESADQINKVHDAMAAAERHKGLPVGELKVIALIETALAVQDIKAITQVGAKSGRLHTVALGAADYATDLGIEMTLEGSELFYPRSRLPVACRSAGIAPPIDTPFMIDLNNLDALEKDTLRAKQLGFMGKLCIHPNQLEIVNRIFSPSLAEIEQARKIVAAFREAEANGQAAVQVDGKFVDPPVVERAKKVIKLARVFDLD